MAGPTLTPNLTDNPFVEVFFDSVHPSAQRLTIYRISENREWLVRGGVDIAVGVAALDFEIPFQTQAAYRAEQFDALGNSLGFTESSFITLDVDDVWVHNPLNPREGVRLGKHALVLGTAESIRRPYDGEHVYIEGAPTARWIGSRRRGIAGMPMILAVEELENADALQAMLSTYSDHQIGVLCVRTPPPVRIPRTLFTSAPDVDEISIDVEWGGTRTDFQFTVTEVTPPFPGLVVPLLTYDDLDAFGNYDQQDAGWITYTERDRAYELAGLAG